MSKNRRCFLVVFRLILEFVQPIIIFWVCGQCLVEIARIVCRALPKILN